jgi:glutathione S-transferase
MESSKKSSLEIYGDLLSQPVRAVVAFCKINKIPYEFKYVNISKGEHLTDEYEKINKYKKIPAIILRIEEKEFKLGESSAILRFLSDFYKCDEKLYPRHDVFRRALIDQWLDWHHNNTRFAASNYVFGKVFKPIFESKGVKTSVYDSYKFLLVVLSFLDKIFEERKFIVDDNISIADLLLVCEINQLILTDFDLGKYKHLNDYLNRMNSFKEMEEVNEPLKKLKIRLDKKGIEPKF